MQENLEVSCFREDIDVVEPSLAEWFVSMLDFDEVGAHKDCKDGWLSYGDHQEETCIG